MMKLFAYLYGAVLGAGAMYFMDPIQGRRRRAMMRDQYERLRNDVDDMLEAGVKDIRNRARGLAAESMSKVSGRPIDDYIVAERARSRLGTLVGYPGLVDLDVQDGRLRISGNVLEDDVDYLIRGLSSIRGVNEIVNDLTTYQDPGQIPNLPENFSFNRDKMATAWAPSTRLLAAAGSLYLLMRGMAGGFMGKVYTLGGLGLGLRAVTNRPLKNALKMGGEEEMIQVNKSIHINAPVEKVYQQWSNFDQFHRFMSNVIEIRSMGNNRHHWTVKGPAGIPVEFDTRVIEDIPNEIISWETLPESSVHHHGQVRFREDRRGGAQASVRMSYSPPAGVVGHAVASFFGKDPKSAMDRDLIRLKSLLETGKTRTEGETVREEDVTAM